MQKKLDFNQKEIFITDDSNLSYQFIGKGKDIFDKSFTVIHSKSDVRSSVIIKAVLFNNSKFILDIKGIVKRGAENVDSDLQVKVLLMSQQASAEVTPCMEVNENNIIGATHGAYIKSIDQEQLFYLQSRGLSLAEAEQMIIDGFLSN